MAPAIVVAVKLKVDPAQIGELEPGVGEPGIGLTTTLVVPLAPVQPATVAFTEYTPAARVVAPGILGF